MSDHSFYSAAFANHFGSSLKIKSITAVAGGCINKTSKIETNGGVFFIKVNSHDQLELFEKEEKGLSILNEKSSINVPTPLGSGVLDKNSYLILSWIDKGHQNEDFWKNFGQLLALQHETTANQFGLNHDNHIGRLHQSNTFHDSWYKFFIQERLEPQIKLAREKNLIDGTIQNDFERLYAKLDQLVPNESPALLHGDLWSGNFICGPSSQPFIFDPAVYYGHRETELAFTTLFGGFDQSFYDAYTEKFPILTGFEKRIEIHNLYPLLVHVNLFGVSYLSGILSTLRRFA